MKNLYPLSLMATFALLSNTTNLDAQTPLSGDASIQPNTFQFEDFNQIHDMTTTITWNDATEVKRVYVTLAFEDEPFEEDLDFTVNDSDGTTATLTIIIPDDKRWKDGSVTIEGAVEFDQGAPAPFYIHIANPSWWVEIYVFDKDTDWPIPEVSLYIHEIDQTVYTDSWGWADLELPEGNYTINFEALGYLPVENHPITVAGDFEYNRYDVGMTRDEDLFLEITHSSPSQNEQNANLNSHITIRFSTKIQEGVIGSGFGEIGLHDSSQNPWTIEDIFISDVNEDELQIINTTPLPAETQFTLTIPIGAVADARSINITLEEPYTLSFKTTSEEPQEPTLTLQDNDTDKVYFEGDFINVILFNPDLPSTFEGVTPTITQGIFTNPDTFEPQTVIPDLSISPISNQTLTLSGIVGSVSSTGAIGIEISITGIGPIGPPFPLADTQLYDQDSGSYFGIALTGISIPAGSISAAPPLDQFDNLYQTEQEISFIKEAEGAITFPAGLNIIDNGLSLSALQTGIKITSNSETDSYFAELNPVTLEFLANSSATIELIDVELKYFTIYTTGFGEQADHNATVDNTANATASLADGILSFSVDGFSRYTALEDLFTLTLVADPAEGGNLENNTGTGPFAAGTIINLSAWPTESFEFLNWREENVPISSEATFNYTMPATDVTLTGLFIAQGTQTWEVSIGIEPESSGSATGSGTYTAGEQVTIEATPSSGHIFVSWSDAHDLNTSDNPYSFEMPESDVALTANFRELINAAINPNNFIFDDFQDADSFSTTITWNDASDVLRTYLYLPHQEPTQEVDLGFSITDNDGTTATLTMTTPENQGKLFKDDSYVVEGFVVFDKGEMASFTLTFTAPLWWTSLKVLDSQAETGIKAAALLIKETQQQLTTDEWGEAALGLQAGSYTISAEAFGYVSVEDFNIEVQGNFAENEFLIMMKHDNEAFVKITDTSISENETHIAVTSPIEIAFERAIQQGTSGQGFHDISLTYDGTSSWNLQSIEISASDKLIIKPEHPLLFETTYTLNIPFDAVADAQNSNIVMENNFSLTFTTESDQPVQEPSINPSVADFFADYPEDIVTTITWNDATTVTAVTEGINTLTEGTDYSVQNNTFTVFKEYFQNGSDGLVFAFLLTFDTGTAQLEVTYYDETPTGATLSISEFTFFINYSNDPVAITITWNDATEITGLYVFEDDDYLPLPGGTADDVWMIIDDNGTTATLMLYPDNVQVKSIRKAKSSIDTEEAVKLFAFFDIGDPVPLKVNLHIKTFLISFTINDTDGNPVETATIEMYPLDSQQEDAIVIEGETNKEFIVAASFGYEYTVEAEGFLRNTGQVINVAENQELPIVLQADDTSVSEEDTPLLSVFPNPASERVNIKAASQIINIELHDINGRTILRTWPNDQQTTLDLRPLAPGTYILRVLTHDGTFIKQIQK